MSSFLPVNKKLVPNSSCLLKLGQVVSGPLGPQQFLAGRTKLGVDTLFAAVAMFLYQVHTCSNCPLLTLLVRKDSYPRAIGIAEHLTVDS